MIKLVEEWLECVRNVGVIHEPAKLRIALAGHDDFNAEAVPVQSRAFMIGWHVWQPVRGLKLKRFAKFNFHEVITETQVMRRIGRRGRSG